MAYSLSSSLNSINRKRALLIGNNNYNRGDKLKYCINNARDLHDKLNTIDFEVILGLNLISEHMDSMIEDFMRNICRDDLIIFFFSGYGIHSNDENYLLSIDDDHITTYQMFKHRTINIENMIEMIMGRHPSAAIFIFDSCRPYFIANQTISKDLINCGGLSMIQPLIDSLIIYSSDANKTSLDKSINGLNTIFIDYLLQHIDQVNISIEEIMDIIYDEIINETNNDQCPFKVNSLRKNIYFNYQIQAEIPQRRNSEIVQIIAQSQNSSLVDLRHQQLTDHEIKIVIQQVIINKQCTRLWLSQNNITSIGGSIIASALNHNYTLERLYLYGNHISDRGVKFICKILSTNNNILKILGLQQNGITDSGALHLAQMLKTNKILTGLWLDNNYITDRGVKLIANVLQYDNSTLEYLDLSKNRLITDISIHSFEDIIKYNQTLNELSLYDCNISQIGKQKLRKSIKLKKNFCIYLNSWNE